LFSVIPAQNLGRDGNSSGPSAVGRFRWVRCPHDARPITKSRWPANRDQRSNRQHHAVAARVGAAGPASLLVDRNGV